MAEPAHILVVDDEPAVREMIEEYLAAHGFVVSTAGSGAECRKVLQAQPVDLVLLDITMPGEDGLSVARHIREAYRAGVIMVTASSATIDRIVGLEIGADDYVSKPFDPRELLARVRSVLRRLAQAADAPTPLSDAVPVPGTVQPTLIGVGRCWLDLSSRRLTDTDGAEIPITAMEFDLLRAFVERPNRVLTRDQLLDLAHNRNWDPFDRSIDIRIARLRKKIEIDPAKPEALKTVRGSGYMFVPGPRTPTG